MKIECQSCSFDLSRLPVSVRFEAQSMEPGRDLTCPLCGSRARLDLMKWGVFTRTAPSGKTYCTWKLDGAAPVRQVAGGFKMERSGMSFVFDKLELVNPQAICHHAIPTFADEGGVASHPAVPVREEYFDCLDLETLRDRLAADPRSVSEVENNRLVCRLPLRGLPPERATVTVTIPVMPPEKGSQTTFRGVNLRVWPTPLPRWRRYLVGLAACDELGERAMAGDRLRARVRGAAGNWRGMGSTQRGGHAAVCAIDGTPEWISIEVGPGAASGDAEAGGMFWIAPPAKTLAAGSLQFGLDFGTSNTCLAYRDGAEQAPKLLPAIDEKRQSLYLIRGGPEALRHAGPDFWPAALGVGAGKDLFPSELLLPKPIQEMTAASKTVDQWVFGVDYGIPGPGVESASSSYREREHVLSEFKWGSMVRQAYPAFTEATGMLQSRFLEACLMQGLVRVVRSGYPIPETITVTYSYPMAFSEDDKKRLDESVHVACERLVQMTGTGWGAQVGVDESRAAAAHVTTDAPMSIYVDMGGGTTDIAILWSPQTSVAKKEEILFSTSVQYAGKSLLDGFGGKESAKGTSCLTPTGRLELKRRVREATRISDLKTNAGLFQVPAFTTTIENRTRHFYHYVVEYVARMIAAALIEGLATVEDRFEPSTDVVVYCLGNGWGFFEFVSPNPYETLVYNIRSRVRAILDAEPMAGQVRDAAGVSPRQVELRFIDGKIKDLPHRKAAVASGVLKANAKEGTVVGGAIGLVGWTTRVNDGKAGTIPWYRRYDTTPRGGYDAVVRRAANTQARSPTAADAGKPTVGVEVEGSLGGRAVKGVLASIGSGQASIRVEIPAERRSRGTVPLSTVRVVGASVAADDIFGALPGASAPDDLFAGQPGAVLGPTVGADVETTTPDGRVFQGPCLAIAGEVVTVEWRSMLVAVSETSLRMAAGASAVATPAGSKVVAVWDVSQPPRLSSGNMILSWKNEPPPVGDSSVRGPFDLDPDLQGGSLSAMRQRGQIYDRDWLTKGAYELMLEVVFREYLWKIGAG